MGHAAAAKTKGRPNTPAPHPKTPGEALAILKRGNKRYKKGELALNDYSPVGEERASRQQPFAAIITCADSRLSPTLIFDVTRGNLFVSRVAGNSIDTGTLGSTEFAVKVLGVKLVMVLGHSSCGAVQAAIDVANGTSSFPPDQFGAIGDVVNEIVPPIAALPASARTLDQCINTVAASQAADIASKTPIIKPAVDAGQIAVVAAVYDIKSGRVSIF